MRPPTGNSLPVGDRIIVGGTTGSGKSTLAGQLAMLLNRPHIELDALYWQPGWTGAPFEDFHAAVESVTQAQAWVVDGNYGAVIDLTWGRADTVIWLDYRLPRILWQIISRSWRRYRSGTLLWGTNRERFWPHFYRRDSLLLWAIQTYGRRRRQYLARFADPAYALLRKYHFRSPPETAVWLADLRHALTHLS